MQNNPIPMRFRRPSQFMFQATLGAEQQAVMRDWHNAEPTIHFLDINMVAATKPAGSKLLRQERKAARIKRLRRLDRPGQAVSYLLALMEKASDPRGKLTDEELTREINRDVAALRAFFKHARVYENDELIALGLENLRGNPIEIARPSYLQFLQSANDRLELANIVAAPNRLRKASEVLHLADELNVPRWHFVVLVTLACLYGSRDARKVLEFKKPGSLAFDPVRRLADLMMIRRFAERKLEIEDLGQVGNTYRRAALVTDDDGVLGLVPFFQFDALVYDEEGEGQASRLNGTVHFLDLLTDLAVRRAQRLDAESDEPDEYDRLCAMIFEEPASAHTVDERGIDTAAS